MPDLQSKLARAIRAVLISEGAGSTDDTFIAFESSTKSLPNTLIDVGGASEQVPFTGNWRFPRVTIVLRDPAAVQPDDTNAASMWTAALARFDLVHNALSRVGDAGEFNFMPGELNTLGRALATDQPETDADMADFTVFWWNINQLSPPRLNAEGNYFEAALEFDAIACNGTF